MTPSRRPAARPDRSLTTVTVSLRTRGGHRLAFRLDDAVLYPRAVAWNRLLVADRFRAAGDADRAGRGRIADEREPQATRALRELAGDAPRRRLDELLDAAVEAGVLQVEIDWLGDRTGYAARLLPWEEIVALATRSRRRRSGRRVVVVRWLRGLDRPPSAAGAAVVAATEDAAAADFAVDTEALLVRRALTQAGMDPGPVGDRGRVLTVDSPRALERRLAACPAVVHFMLRSVDRGLVYTAAEQRASERHDARSPAAGRRRGLRPRDRGPALETLLGAGRPAIVAFSSCYTGRRLAPRTVAAGAAVAVGFHQEVDDANLPGFFAPFYERVLADGDVVGAAAAALDANRGQPDHDGLGAVTIWSDRDLLARPASGRHREPAAPRATPTAAAAEPTLLFDCAVEAALNYAVLHNSHGGIFRRFMVTRLAPDATAPEAAAPLEVVVRLDTGAGPPAECRFIEPAPTAAGSRIDLARLVSLPLGAELLRQRREATRATVEVMVGRAGRTLFHITRPVPLLPCDEWRDDRAGRHFLPSFIFPRDPAVRTILAAAGAHLRAIADDPAAAFDGYQRGGDGGTGRAVDAQAQAIWWAAQEGFGIDYAEPPPTYTAASQRLRTPEEILRGRRATCIELSLLLASCFEHVGLEPVILLTRGHALCGYWSSPQSRERFAGDVAADDAQPPEDRGSSGERLGGMTSRRDVIEPWMLAEPWHLRRIVRAAEERQLVPVEATGLARKQGFRAAVAVARELLAGLADDDFDGMLDVHAARGHGVTPLPIITEGPAA